MTPTVRVGQGFDIHPFSPDPDRVMILGGVEFDGPGLAGHSDADVVAHAVIDALLGAAGLGDIGVLFPDSDPSLAGADSMVLLTDAVRRVIDAGFTLERFGEPVADDKTAEEWPSVADTKLVPYFLHIRGRKPVAGG